ncbi:MAG: hypothetical protein M3285_03160 [Actinomycetota bacterium]|nr:hypothetical protein [Actinomycetota bacterium]MDQ3954531.1 hypothetical protein [Actinomycetota bacterium]
MAKAQQELRGRAIYDITIEDENGLRTEQLEAVMYTTSMTQGDPFVTFWGLNRPIASFNSKYVREIRLVRELTAGDDVP